MLKKKIWANFQRIIELLTKKIVKKLFKIWSWDPGSGKNPFRIQGSKRHLIPDPDPQHCILACHVLNDSGPDPAHHFNAEWSSLFTLMPSQIRILPFNLTLIGIWNTAINHTNCAIYNNPVNWQHQACHSDRATYNVAELTNLQLPWVAGFPHWKPNVPIN